MRAIRRNALSAMRMPIESLDLRSRDWHLAHANPVSRTRAERQQGQKERFHQMKRVKTAKVRGVDAMAAAQAELMSCAAGIVAQNRQLMRRAKARGFSPATELDFTANGAGVLIQRMFEAVAAFEEGSVPWRLISEMAATTDALVNALKARRRAPVEALDAVGVAFRECMIPWRDSHSPPRMPPQTYQKRLFRGRDRVFEALKALHAEYVKAEIRRGQKSRTLSAAATEAKDRRTAEERRAICAEIDRRRRLGQSVTRAIRSMMHGSYEARMRGVKAASWRIYYHAYVRDRESHRGPATNH